MKYELELQNYNFCREETSSSGGGDKNNTTYVWTRGGDGNTHKISSTSYRVETETKS